MNRLSCGIGNKMRKTRKVKQAKRHLHQQRLRTLTHPQIRLRQKVSNLKPRLLKRTPTTRLQIQNQDSQVKSRPFLVREKNRLNRLRRVLQSGKRPLGGTRTLKQNLKTDQIIAFLTANQATAQLRSKVLTFLPILRLKPVPITPLWRLYFLR